MRKLYIHCGLHKTGTTAIQRALRQKVRDLATVNLYYPQAGIPPIYKGHHNIAWQLSRDRRYRPEYGTIAALVREVKEVDATIVITSEDFESSLLRPRRWGALLGPLQDSGFDVALVVYLRDPVNYIESLYLENLKHGFGEEYGRVVQRVCHTGRLSFNEWEFCFDYDRLRAVLSSMTGVEVIYRDYDNLVGGSSVVDFASVLGVEPSLFGTVGENRQINKRVPISKSLASFVKNRETKRLEKQQPSLVTSIIERLCLGLNGRPVTPPGLRQRLHAALVRTARDISGSPEGDAHVDEELQTGLNMARVFSLETGILVRDLAVAIADKGVSRAGEGINTFVSKKSEWWRGWVREEAGKESRNDA